jgi:RNA polymerase sigma-70 factor (ECF subfamily)
VEKSTLRDEELMAALQGGRADALSELHGRYAPRLRAFFLRMLGGDAEKALDFTQDTFTRILENPAAFDVERRFSTWIYTVASNLCKNEYRRMAVRRRIDRPDADVSRVKGSSGEELARSVDLADFMEELTQALGKLDEERRTTFILRFQQDLSIKEIAEITGVSEGTVKSRLFYITRQLSGQLKHLEPLMQTGS